jgi:hypothetical protein
MKMKISIIMLFLINIGIIFADDACLNCKNEYNGTTPPYYQHQVAYKYCDPINHKIVQLCTNGDPYNLPQPNTGWQPMKLCLPLTWGTTVTYSNTDEPWKSEGPWQEQIWDGQYNNSFQFLDSDIPDLIQAALSYWQSICSPPYNNSDCQSCPIKIMWTKDASKLGDDKLLPSHISNPVSSGDGCSFDCSKLAIILNGTSGFSSVNSSGKPTQYFLTRGGDRSIQYGNTLVNTDLRTEMMHQLGALLGFANTTPDGDPGCGQPCSMMSSRDNKTGWGGTFLYVQGNRIEALSTTQGSINPPYNFVHNPGCDYDDCAFRLLYCCVPVTSVPNNGFEDFNEFEINPIPSSSNLHIQININMAGNVDLGIYNLLGVKLKSLINNNFLEQNVYKFDVDLEQFVSGTYFCMYKIADRIQTKIFTIMK